MENEEHVEYEYRQSKKIAVAASTVVIVGQSSLAEPKVWHFYLHDKSEGGREREEIGSESGSFEAVEVLLGIGRALDVQREAKRHHQERDGDLQEGAVFSQDHHWDRHAQFSQTHSNAPPEIFGSVCSE